jgi:hypothetical protein
MPHYVVFEANVNMWLYDMAAKASLIGSRYFRKNLPNLAGLPVYDSPFSGDMVGSMKTQPQQLSREAIDDFKAIYQDEFGDILSDDEVREIAMRLLRFFGILTKGDSGSVDASNLPR